MSAVPSRLGNEKVNQICPSGQLLSCSAILSASSQEFTGAARHFMLPAACAIDLPSSNISFMHGNLREYQTGRGSRR